MHVVFFPELPVNIVKPLQDTTALEKSRVLLDCTVSNPRCSIRWYKGSNVILPSERFEICSEGCYRKLIIQQVVLDDEGMYSVQVGEYTCSAKLTVEGKTVHDQFGAPNCFHLFFASLCTIGLVRDTIQCRFLFNTHQI